MVPMHSEHTKRQRPTCVDAGGALFVVRVRGSSSGLGRGDYTPETSVRTWLLAPFKWDRAVWKQPGPVSLTPGLGPEAID
jgi:hypothetical protein